MHTMAQQTKQFFEESKSGNGHQLVMNHDATRFLFGQAVPELPQQMLVVGGTIFTLARVEINVNAQTP